MGQRPPPPLLPEAGEPRSAPDGTRPHPGTAVLTLIALAGAVLLVRLAEGLHLPLPFCGLRRLTGLPCPGCGSTRSLLAWAGLHPLEALRLNPLVFLVMVGLAAWAITQLADRYLGTRLSAKLPTLQGRRWPLRLLLGALTANWVYLWLTLPK